MANAAAGSVASIVLAVFTRPEDLPDSLVVDTVQSAWSLSIDSVSYAAVGYGSHHWHAEGEGRRWFVTVDDLVARARDLDAGADAANLLNAALTTARMLFEAGMTFVVAPVPATSGDVLVPIGDRYLAAIYPWVDGQKFEWGEFATGAERFAVLDRLVSLHRASPDARRFAHTEDFSIPARDRMAVIVDQLAGWDRGPFGMPARRLLDEHGISLSEQFRQYDGLAARVRDRRNRMVLTHGEPHRANTIATPSGVLLVDWDTVLIAPPERDLWWLAGDDTTAVDEYERRTGAASDAVALDLYRLWWRLADIASFAVQLHCAHEDDEDSRVAWEALAAALRDADR